MKLFKVTYEKICNPSEGFHKVQKEAYYFCNSLDRLYNYIENEQSFTVLTIEILRCTMVEQNFKSFSTAIKEYANTEQIIKAQ